MCENAALHILKWIIRLHPNLRKMKEYLPCFSTIYNMETFFTVNILYA